MKVFVTGVTGQLGFDVTMELIKRGYEPIASGRAEEYTGFKGTDAEKVSYVPLDFTDEGAVFSVLEKVQPDAVIHCAAWTAVDAAEEPENREKVMAVNARGTEYIAKACKEISAKLLYTSTDYVFDGNGEKPWEPDCKAYKPLNVYGESKLLGEQAVVDNLNRFFIVRIAWTFGKNGSNFIRTMLSLAKKYNELRVVSDQIGTPTYTYDLARLLVDMILTEKYGYYHATNEGGYISWADFAEEIFKQAAALGCEECAENSMKVIPVTTAEYGASKALRPFNSRLEKGKLKEQGFEPLPDWKDALKRYLKDILSENHS